MTQIAPITGVLNLPALLRDLGIAQTGGGSPAPAPSPKHDTLAIATRLHDASDLSTKTGRAQYANSLGETLKAYFADPKKSSDDIGDKVDDYLDKLKDKGLLSKGEYDRVDDIVRGNTDLADIDQGHDDGGFFDDLAGFVDDGISDIGGLATKVIGSVAKPLAGAFNAVAPFAGLAANLPIPAVQGGVTAFGAARVLTNSLSAFG